MRNDTKFLFLEHQERTEMLRKKHPIDQLLNTNLFKLANRLLIMNMDFINTSKHTRCMQCLAHIILNRCSLMMKFTIINICGSTEDMPQL